MTGLKSEDERAPELVFDNAAVRLRIVNQQPAYEVRWAPFDNNAGTAGAVGATVNTDEPRAAIPPDAWGPPDAAGFRYAVATIATIQPAFPHWRKPVLVTVRNRDGRLDVVGIDRSTDLANTAAGDRRARRGAVN